MEGMLPEAEQEKFEKELRTDRNVQEDYTLYNLINTSMQAKFDLEEVNNDPVREEIEPWLDTVIAEYQSNPVEFEKISSFVSENTWNMGSEIGIHKETEEIKRDIKKYGLEEITEGWVEDWFQKKEGPGHVDEETGAIRDFVMKSLGSDKPQAEMKAVHRIEANRRDRKLIFSAILAAASVIGVFIILKNSLLPGDPEKLYRKYYTSFDAIGQVTRNDNASLSPHFERAVDLYQKGDYIMAATVFSEVFNRDSSFFASRFLEGISRIELGEYDDAISCFSYVISHSLDYSKESRWYLGLAYLKTGATDKAAACFESLASDDGYYRERAEKILRRLKK
jgi:tetratricopeptide (TPR) repeat protein